MVRILVGDVHNRNILEPCGFGFVINLQLGCDHLHHDSARDDSSNGTWRRNVQFRQVEPRYRQHRGRSASETKLQDLTDKEEIEDYNWKLALLKNELSKEMVRVPDIEFNYIEDLTTEKFTPQIGINTKEYIEKLRVYYQNMFNVADKKRNAIVAYWNEKSPDSHNRLRQAYLNEAVQEIVVNYYAKSPIKAYKDHLIQMKDPIYETPWSTNIFDYRAQFYSPVKYFLGHEFNTFWFNMWVVWLMTAFCYVALYYDWLKRSMEFFPEITKNAMMKLSMFIGKFKKKGASETDKKE